MSDAQLNSARNAWRQYARAGIRSDAAEVRRTRGRLGLGLAVIGVVGLIAWGVMGRAGDSKKRSRKPKVVSAEPTPTPMLGPAPEAPKPAAKPVSNVMPLEVENDGRGPVSVAQAESPLEIVDTPPVPRAPGVSPLAKIDPEPEPTRTEPMAPPAPAPEPEPVAAAVAEPEPAPEPKPAAEPLPEPSPGDEIIELPPAQRVAPPDTRAANARAFRRIPLQEGDGEPLGGVGEYGVHIDRIETGREVDHGHCESPTASFEGGEETANVCFRVLHRREEQRLIALWEHNGHVVRRTKLTIPKQRAWWTRASVKMREDQTGPWIVRVVSDDGVELARTSFTVR